MGKKAFITGMTGFVGRYLQRHLSSLGYKVEGTSFNGDTEGGVAHQVDLASFEGLEKLREVLKAFQPNEVYHLAAFSSPKASFANPLECHKVNYLGTASLLEALKVQKKSPKFLFVSTAEVYGNPDVSSLPLTEASPLHAASPYAASKRAAEVLVQAEVDMGNIEAVIARPFNHFGPGQSEAFVLPDFSSQLAEIEKGEREAVMKVGNLSAKRDFSDVRDIVSAYPLLLQKGENGGYYNICSESSVAISDCLNILASFLSKEVRVEIDQKRFRDVDIADNVGCCEKLKKQTGWKPRYSLEESLHNLYKHYYAEQ